MGFKTNKHLIDELQKYFLTQDQKTICRTLAAIMVDLHRVNNFESLGLNERENLVIRMDFNSQALLKFAKYGPDGDFVCHNIESQDD